MEPEEQRSFRRHDQEIKRLANLLMTCYLTKTEEKILRRKAVDLKPLLEEVMLRTWTAPRPGHTTLNNSDNPPQALINGGD